MSTSNIQHEEAVFPGAENLELYEQSWRPRGACRAVVILVHGAAEHGGRYSHVAECLAQHGYAASVFDLRGHGRSDGERGYVRSFDLYLEDLDRFLDRIRNRRPEEPLFLLGHSMGGTITTLYVIKRRPEIDGLLLSGPGVMLGKSISSVMVYLANTLGRLFPRIPLISIDSGKISRDPGVVERYENDPLVYHGAFPARSAAQLLRAMKKIEAHMEAVDVPLLVMHGTEDQLVDVQGSQQLYDRAASRDRTLQLYEGYYHELFNEPDRERVLEDMTAWLNART